MYGSLITYYSMRFYDYFEDNWGSIMIYVNKNWYNPDTMGCFGGKYYRNMNSTDFYDLKCDDKRDLSILWE